VQDPLDTPVGPGRTEGMFDAAPPIDGIEGFSWETGEDIPF
jgi:hypothetical protein